MTPMMLLVLHTTSVNVYGYSWFSFTHLVFYKDQVGVTLFLIKDWEIGLRPFIHQLFSISFL